MMMNFAFYTTDSFCIYTSCVLHVIENSYYPSQRFCSGGEIIINLINNICSTFCEIIELLKIWGLDLLSSLVQLCLLLTKLQRSFYPLILFAQYMKKDINLFYLFQNASFAPHFTGFYIKYFFRKTHSTFLYSTYKNYVFLKNPVSNFNTSVQTIPGNVSSIKSNLLFCSNNKIFDVVSSLIILKWSITSSCFSCIW